MPQIPGFPGIFPASRTWIPGKREKWPKIPGFRDPGIPIPNTTHKQFMNHFAQNGLHLTIYPQAFFDSLKQRKVNLNGKIGTYLDFISILESNKNGGIIASNYKEKGTILFGISVVVLILLFAYYKFCRAGKMAPRRRRKKSMPKRA